MKKYLLAASAIAMGLSMASGALADSDANGNDGNVLSAVGNSSNDGADNNNLEFLSNNSDDDEVNLLSGNSDDDVRDNDIGSHNDDNGDNRGNIVDSGNIGVEVDVEVEVDIDNSINDSVVANQDLDANVSDVSVNFEGGALLLAAQNGDLVTGDIAQRGDAFRGFTGIATIAMDTGVQSNNQAAGQVAAGSDISFD